MDKNREKLEIMVRAGLQLMAVEQSQILYKEEKNMGYLRIVKKNLAPNITESSIIAFCDMSFLNKSGREGWLFTTNGIYCAEWPCIRFKDIYQAKITKKREKDENSECVVYFRDGTERAIRSIYIKKSKFVLFIEMMIKFFNSGDIDIVEDNLSGRLMVIEDTDDAFKKAYMNYIIEFINFRDDFGPVVLSRIYSLMARIKVHAKTRQEIVEEIFCRKDKDQLLAELNNHYRGGPIEAVYISLLKDIMVVTGAGYGDAEKEQRNRIDLEEERLFLTREQAVIIQEIAMCEKRFKQSIWDSKTSTYRDFDETEFVREMRVDALKAILLKLPAAAFFLSGSVSGLEVTDIVGILHFLGLDSCFHIDVLETGKGISIADKTNGYRDCDYMEKSDKGWFSYIWEKRKGVIRELAEDISYFAEKFTQLMYDYRQTSEEEDAEELISKIRTLMETAAYYTKPDNPQLNNLWW